MLYFERGDDVDKFTGYLTKIRLLKKKPLLVRFTLVAAGENINCVVAREILANQVLMMPDDKYSVNVGGYFNNKKQLVIRYLNVNNPDNFSHDLGL